MYRRARTASILRRHAKVVLDKFGVTEPPVPVREIVEGLGAEVRLVSFEDRQQISGMIIRGEDHVIIGVNINHPENRRRFTIAHECGHFLLHKSKELYIDKEFSVQLRGRKASAAVDPDEIEANRFAAELLMPYDMLVKDLSKKWIDIENEAEIQKLSNKYKVSRQAMTFRIQNLLQDL